jgi:hypothetical protein
MGDKLQRELGGNLSILRRRKSVVGHGDVDGGGAKYASTHTRNVNTLATSIQALLINVANVAFRNKQDST